MAVDDEVKLYGSFDGGKTYVVVDPTRLVEEFKVRGITGPCRRISQIDIECPGHRGNDTIRLYYTYEPGKRVVRSVSNDELLDLNTGLLCKNDGVVERFVGEDKGDLLFVGYCATGSPKNRITIRPIGFDAEHHVNHGKVLVFDVAIVPNVGLHVQNPLFHQPKELIRTLHLVGQNEVAILGEGMKVWNFG